VSGAVSCYLPQSDGALAKDPTSRKIQICMTVELSLSISQMASLVRSAEVHGERAILTAFLSKYLSPDADNARYEWLYCRNPKGWRGCGAGVGSLRANNRQDYRSVGRVSPPDPPRSRSSSRLRLRRFLYSSGLSLSWPALALQRRTLEDLSREGAGFVEQ
jgi:hypothetical protein